MTSSTLTDTTRPNVHISYSQPVWPYHRQVAKLVEKHAADSGTLLDIGCGVGHALVEINKRKPRIQLHAADIDDGTLDITSERVKLAGRLKINTVEDLFDVGHSFDVVILSHVLEHTYRPLDVVKGVMSLVRPGGVAVLAVPNPVRLEVIISSLLRVHYVNRGHVCAWDRSHWINFLENIAGLDVIEYSQDFFPLRGLNKLKFVRPFERLLSRIMPWLSFSNLAVVRAPKMLNARD